jgi:hypothetical protein
MNAVDPQAICAELRAVELAATLRDAVAGAPNWRLRARILLADIAALRLPELACERLREIDAQKRAMEIAADMEEHHHA